jgi:hypothetical protein
MVDGQWPVDAGGFMAACSVFTDRLAWPDETAWSGRTISARMNCSVAIFGPFSWRPTRLRKANSKSSL